MASLLDINVLVALIDEAHSSHITASNWFNVNHTGGWLTSPLTQNGCVRVLSQPQYPGAMDIETALRRLRSAVLARHHQFISDDVSILDDTLIDARRLSGYRQLTDAYLLALAVAHDAKLVTLDTRIPSDAVRGAAKSHLVVL